jgi:hypothetical protein
MGLVLIYKHLGSAELVFKLPVRMMMDLLAAVVFLVKGKSKNAGAVLDAHADFFRQMKNNSIKRRAIVDQYPTYNRRTMHPGLIIFDYFLRKKKTYSINSPK